MNTSTLVHYAVACLEGLDAPRAPRELSQVQQVPLEDCLFILQQLELAGIIRENASGLVERTCSMDDITALQVLQAVLPSGDDARMLYGGKKLLAAQVTRHAVSVAAWPRG